MVTWNPWHGCHKISEGCRHCYVYREDAAFQTELPTSNVRRTGSFDLPMRRKRDKSRKFPSGTEFGLCFTSDLLIEEADCWRDEIWDIIRRRDDCSLFSSQNAYSGLISVCHPTGEKDTAMSPSDALRKIRLWLIPAFLFFLTFPSVTVLS